MIYESFFDGDYTDDVEDIFNASPELSVEEEGILKEELKDPNALFQAFLLDEISRMSDEEKSAFVNSEACDFLVNEGMLAKRNVLKLTKESDLERRIKVAALQIGKDKGDSLYEKALKYRALSKQSVAAIVKKYRSQAERVAKVAQKAYIRKNPITMKIVATPENIKKSNLFDTDRSETV